MIGRTLSLEISLYQTSKEWIRERVMKQWLLLAKRHVILCPRTRAPQDRASLGEMTKSKRERETNHGNPKRGSSTVNNNRQCTVDYHTLVHSHSLERFDSGSRTALSTLSGRKPTVSCKHKIETKLESSSQSHWTHRHCSLSTPVHIQDEQRRRPSHVPGTVDHEHDCEYIDGSCGRKLVPRRTD